MVFLSNDIFFMRMALEQACKAQEKNEVPIGAIVVDAQEKVLGKGYNLTQTYYGQNNHAEIRAIAQAGRKIQDWRLDDCTLYVTLQPCLMCMSLIGLSRIKRLVYGAPSPLFGYHLDKEGLPDLYKKHIKGITSGILAQEAQLLLKNFFKNKRNNREQLSSY